MTRYSIEAALDALKRGEIVLVSDNEDREDEGDFVMAAEAATPEKIGFINRYSTGIICAPLTAERQAQLDLPAMVQNNSDPKETAFTVSVDLRHGTTTGVSAADRALTIASLASAQTKPGDLTRPGHVFPLVAKAGGVLQRDGHTEAAVDMARLAGFAPVGAICEVVNDDGSMARRPQIADLSDRHSIPFVTIEQLISHRLKTETVARIASEAVLEHRHSVWKRHDVAVPHSANLAQVYVLGAPVSGDPVSVLHASSATIDAILSSSGPEDMFRHSVTVMERTGRGVIIVLPAEAPERSNQFSEIEVAVASQSLGLICPQAQTLRAIEASPKGWSASYGLEILERQFVRTPETKADILAAGLELLAS